MDKTVGILGGGQLGRMMLESANNLGIKVIVLDSSESCPANQINSGGFVKGSFKDPQAIKTLAGQVDVVTIEIEHVDADALKQLSDGHASSAGPKLPIGTKVNIQPHPETIKIIQDKFAQKQHLIERGISVAKSVAIEDEDFEKAVKLVGGFPCMLKCRLGSYDGRGNALLRSDSEIPKAIKALGSKALYVEGWVPFIMELAVMVVKTVDSPADWTTSTLAFPVVESIHDKDRSICKLVFCPPRKVHEKTMLKAQEIARKAVAGFGGKGVFGVEMFLLPGEDILINEIAPRPHNSGHYTIEACGISQFEAHLRAILGLPIDAKSLEADRSAIMLNILGSSTPTGHLELQSEAAKISRASIHMYGKGNATPGRKMGHITITSKTLADAEEKIKPLIDLADRLQAEQVEPKTTARTEHGPSGSKTAVSTTTSTISGPPQIAITMGSDSDKNVLDSAAALLRKLGVPYESNITSAHRTPERMFKFAREAADRGIKVIIAAAGGAAHLPGMIAACTSLPVIGVPVKASHLGGVDSLLSVVSMPRGCPVATVGINNGENAAQLSLRILALSDPEVKRKLDNFLLDQTNQVLVKAERMQQLGIEGYTPPPAG